MIWGLLLAMALAWLTIQAGEQIKRRNGGLSRRLAVGIGLGVGLIIWAALRMWAPWPMEIIDGLAIGPGVGLAQGLTKSEPGK
jgi:xanthine/uracil permease